jgi:hypothetical protein
MNHRLGHGTALGLIVMVALNLPFPMRGLAAECGGNTPCACGDNVIASRTLVRGVDPVIGTPCLGDGLTITAEGVVLDLGWTTIQGSLAPGSIGIAVDALPSSFTALIRNGTVSGFGVGLSGGEGVRVERMKAFGNAGAGIALITIFGATSVRTSVARGNGGVGIEVWCGAILDSYAEENGADGIVLQTPACGGRIHRVVSRENGGAGVVFEGDGGRIDRSLAIRNEGPGYVIRGEDLSVTRAQAVDNGGDGFATRASYSFFSRLRSKGNAGFGITATSIEWNGYGRNYCQGDALGDSKPKGLCR